MNLCVPIWHSNECFICFEDFCKKRARLNPTQCNHSLCLVCWKKYVKLHPKKLNCCYCMVAKPTTNSIVCDHMTMIKTVGGDYVWVFDEPMLHLDDMKLVHPDHHQIQLNRMTGLKPRYKLKPEYNPDFEEEMKSKDVLYKNTPPGQGGQVGGISPAMVKPTHREWILKHKLRDLAYKIDLV